MEHGIFTRGRPNNHKVRAPRTIRTQHFRQWVQSINERAACVTPLPRQTGAEGQERAAGQGYGEERVEGNECEDRKDEDEGMKPRVSQGRGCHSTNPVTKRPSASNQAQTVDKSSPLWRTLVNPNLEERGFIRPLPRSN